MRLLARIGFLLVCKHALLSMEGARIARQICTKYLFCNLQLNIELYGNKKNNAPVKKLANRYVYLLKYSI